MVTQLMTVEGNTQKLLQAQKTKQQSTLTALQTMNTNVKAIQTAAEAMITSVIAPRAWTVNNVTSSSTSVTASATSAATTGSYTLDVLSVATAHKLLYGTAVSGTASVGGGSLSITQGTTTTSVDLSGATTLAQVVAAINNTAGLGVKASALQVGTDSYRLQLGATTAGAASQFTASGLSGSLGAGAVIAAGTDASVKFGPGAGDIATSTTNTISNLYTGLSFTVTKPETGVVLTVGQDTATMSTQVAALVKAANTAVSTIASQSAYTVASKSGGPLLGESLPTSLSNSITSALYSGTGGSLAGMGVSIDRSGAILFDTTKFTAAMAADSAATVTALTGFATRLGTIAKAATGFSTGTITKVIQSRQSLISDLGTQISDWDTKLTDKQAQLTKQYAALNTQITTMNNQASWLSGQFTTMAAG
jgi:flagellar hook-associated protein 2